MGGLMWSQKQFYSSPPTRVSKLQVHTAPIDTRTVQCCKMAHACAFSYPSPRLRLGGGRSVAARCRSTRLCDVEQLRAVPRILGEARKREGHGGRVGGRQVRPRERARARVHIEPVECNVKGVDANPVATYVAACSSIWQCCVQLRRRWFGSGLRGMRTSPWPRWSRGHGPRR